MNPPVEIGEILAGKYRVERVLGAGGMGVVVAATHLELGQRVAMKFLLAEGMGSPEVAARFMREARAAARIRGEHVARVIDVGKLESGSPYIVMEYLEGLDLEALVKEEAVPIEDAVDYLIQACDAMAEAHRLGIIHRDLKPANLFRAQGVDGQAVIKVLDFGISKSPLDTTAGSLTATSALVGSPLYMSPEQMRSSRNVDHRTDIWSLGAVLFELLAGHPPFDGETVGELMAKVLMDPLPSLRAFRPEVPEGLEAVVARCLEKDPNTRFANVAELSQALHPYAPHRSALAVERVHRILGSIPPPPVTSSAPPAGGSTPAPGAPAPSLSQVAEFARGAQRPGQSFASGKTADEPAGKRTTLGWGSEGKKGSGGGKVVAVALAGVAAAVTAFFVFRPSEEPAATSPASGAPGTVTTVDAPAPTIPAVPAPPAVVPVVAPEPPPSASAAPSPPASASTPPVVSARTPATPAPKPPSPRPARADTTSESAMPGAKPKDSRLHMELKK